MVHIENTKFLNVQNYAQFEHTGEAGIILSLPVIITQMIGLLYGNITRTNEQLKTDVTSDHSSDHRLVCLLEKKLSYGHQIKYLSTTRLCNEQNKYYINL